MSHWSSIKENRFNYLLTILLILFVFSPFMNVGQEMRIHPIVPTIYMLAVLGLLRTMIDRNKEFIILATVKLFGFMLEMMAINHVFPTNEHAFHIAARILQIFFFLLFVVHLMRWLFKVEEVSADTIKGGICVYMLLGFLWSAMYRLVFELHPQAYEMKDPAFWKFVYFSFITLTTIGYGDIVPTHSITMLLTTLEGMVGQLFLAIFVARLVGLHLIQKVNSIEKK